MYENTDKVLQEIKEWFVESFKENFHCKRDSNDEFVVYQSKSYQFKVTVGFIQANIEDDLEVPIRERLETTLEDITVEKGKQYKLFSKGTSSSLLMEYSIKSIS